MMTAFEGKMKKMLQKFKKSAFCILKLQAKYIMISKSRLIVYKKPLALERM